MQRPSRFLAAGLVCFAACTGSDPGTEDGRDDSFGGGKADGLTASGAETAAILRLVNTASQADLDDVVGISSTAARNILALRNGPDAQLTNDNDAVSTLVELDAVPYVGPATFSTLLDHVHAQGLVGEEPAPWKFETLATGDDASFVLDLRGAPMVAYRNASDAYELRLADGSTLALPADVTKAPQIGVDPYDRLHLLYPVGAMHKHATTSGTSWTERPGLEYEQLFVAQGPSGRLHALGGKRSTQVDGYSYLAAISFPNVALETPLWQAPLTALNHGFAVDSDGWPGMAFSKSGLRQSHANRDGSGWTPRDIDSSHTADAIATTAGVDDVTVAAHMVYEHDLRIYRMRDGAYYAADQLASAVPTSLVAKSDGRGGAHICAVAEGNITYVELAADGSETVTDLGAGEQCAIDVDVAHAVHLFTRSGTTIRHGVR